MAVAGSQVVCSFGVFSAECLLLRRCGAARRPDSKGRLWKRIVLAALVRRPGKRRDFRGVACCFGRVSGNTL